MACFEIQIKSMQFLQDKMGEGDKLSFCKYVFKLLFQSQGKPSFLLLRHASGWESAWIFLDSHTQEFWAPLKKSHQLPGLTSEPRFTFEDKKMLF